MWMAILKNAKGNFVELETMLEGVDSKYLKGGLYFPRSDLPKKVYEELWFFIKKNMGRMRYHIGLHDKGGFDVYPQVNGNNDYSKTPENYAYSLKIRPMVPPTLRQTASWMGALVKPENVLSNWKTPDKYEEYKSRLQQLQGFKDAFPDITVPHRYRDDTFEENPRYTPYREEFDEWVKENMIENPKKDQTIRFNLPHQETHTLPAFGGSKSRAFRTGEDRSGSALVNNLREKQTEHQAYKEGREGTIDNLKSFKMPNQEEWDAVHSGYFILKVYHNKKRIINVDLRLNVGFKMPPVNLNIIYKEWKSLDEEGKRLSTGTIGGPTATAGFTPLTPKKQEEKWKLFSVKLDKMWDKWRKAVDEWHDWYKAYDKHMESQEDQVKVQKALVAIFDMAQNYEEERFDVNDLFK